MADENKEFCHDENGIHPTSNGVEQRSVKRRKSSLKRTHWHGAELYDRAAQQQTLYDAYYRSKQESEIVLITGASGTGKTALANTLLPLVESDGGLFLRGKFDQHQYLDSIPSPLGAFQFFAKRVIARGEEQARIVKSSIERALGSDVAVILEMIPELAELLTPEEWIAKQEEKANSSGQDSSETSAFNKEIAESQARVVSVFRRFLQSCCSRERPIVLFLDDLQWADEFSLACLRGRMFATKNEMKAGGILLLATCRGNEVSVDDQLSVILRGLEAKGTRITDIQVGNLSFDALTDMVTNALHLPRAECLPLVEVVYNQTQGNAFFAIQFLRSLEEDGILFQDGDKGGRWNWKAEALIVSLEATGNYDLIVQLLANKMKELPPDVLEVVKVASCLRDDFTEELLLHLGCATSQQEVVDALDRAEEEGAIVYDFDTGTGYFSHDKFKEAAYALIPDEEKAAFHLHLVRSLRHHMPLNASKSYVAIFLDQLSVGIGELKDPAEREDYAFICLRAARKAGKAASFVAGSEYAELGIRLLERRLWRDQYAVSLDLFNSAAELAYCSGKHQRVHELVMEVLQHARSSDDKLHVQITKIMSLAAQHETSAAIAYCIEVLRRLGQPFPKKPQWSRIVYGYIKTRRSLAHITDDDIMNLPPLTDAKTLTAMVFIHQLFPLVNQQRFEYSPLIAFRLVHLTLKHGLSAVSSAAFAVLGGVLGRAGRADEGFRYIKLSFRILSRYPSDHWMSRCILVASGTVLPVKEPLRDVIQPLMTGHRLGLKSGELEVRQLYSSIDGCWYQANSQQSFLSKCGMLCGLWLSLVRMLVGEPLPKVAKGMLQLIQLCHDCNQIFTAGLTSFLYEMNLNLQGKAKDPLKIVGALADEDVLFAEAKKEHRTMLVISYHYFKHMIAFYADDYEAANSIRKSNQKILSSSSSPLPMFRAIQIFHEGLVATSLSWRSKNMLSLARKRLKILEAMVIDCPENAAHKAYLLNAEILAREGRHDQAMCKYVASIKYSEKAGFVNEQGLANEKVGRMLLRCDKGAQALPYIKEARALYERWGAGMKVVAMDTIIAELHVKGQNENEVFPG